MRQRPVIWFLLSALCFAGAYYFWRLGEQWAARRTVPAGPASSRVTQHASGVSSHQSSVTPIRLLSQAGALNMPPVTDSSVTNDATRITNRLSLRLSNTTATVGQLQRRETAILLENALLDTAQGLPSIPAHLRAQGDPGSYIVQSRGPIGDAFRSMLQAAGASVISYIPNNAYLVRASAGVAQQMRANPQTQAVLPYEPYYKLKPSLLKLAAAQEPMPAGSGLDVLLFADGSAATVAALEDMGLKVMGEERSPFGPVVKVMAGGQAGRLPYVTALAAIAALPGVQELEWTARRMAANDISRVTVGISTDTLVTNNYLGLTGTNVLVNVNDSGVDATQPDLTPRVFGPATNALVDGNGHGTHVAGIIASSGAHSTNTVNVGAFASGSVSNANFRGKAPFASVFSLPVGMTTGPFSSGVTLTWPSDAYLQETAARTNVFISNNSWNYVGPDSFPSYDLHAASYDAAVRDALPAVPGSQPLLYVFSAGNAGGGASGGIGGNADTILSPATAKNVITIGAIEQYRSITNIVTKIDGGATNSSTPWLSLTDSSNMVASFSSRGNVGVSIEGDSGRFKPDLVAPGVFVVSTRSQQWDTNAYYNPTGHITTIIRDMLVPTNVVYRDVIYVPANAVQLNLTMLPNTNSPVPFPDLPLYVKQSAPPTNPPPDYDAVGTNRLSLPPDSALSPVAVDWFYGIGNSGIQAVAFDLLIDIVVTNDMGDYLQVLAAMNDSLGPYYRYESGTSMAAADASGTLALMQEFFEQRLGRTNSPALMKALLINGARSVNSIYDFNTRAGKNFQGWGLINLATSLPAALTNVTATANTMFVVDQSPQNALASGQSRTYRVTLTPSAQNQPLRVTLVWTDPPGNPVASVKLVNDLDLVVTNLDSTNVIYFGNDITVGSTFNQAWDTNSPPMVDTVNNVENVFLSPAQGIDSRLSTNYSITVVGHRVNVNAVTAQTNNVSQDYALVISCGDGLVTNALSFNTNDAIVSVTQPLVTVITNSFGSSSSNFAGGFLLNQRAGANTQLQGTNTVPITNDANAVLTVGMTNQWHFYIITNSSTFTNAAFLTFLPPTLSIPPMGVFSASIDNATRHEADIDIYVAPPTIPNNYALTNLDSVVLAAADKAIGRGGTETLIYSNAVADGVYYIGVKCEDQMAAQYALMGVFSRFPFGSSDANGNQSLIGIPSPQPIPDAAPGVPGVAYVMAICAQPILVRRAIVTNTINHELISDLLGNLNHSGGFVVLNNHTCVNNPATLDCYTYYTYIYDDSSEANVTGAQRTDGPGSLRTFAGQDGVGQWLLTMTDSAPNHFGTNVNLNIFLEKQQDLTGVSGVAFSLPPGACREDFVELPVNAISLSVTGAVVTASPPTAFSIDICPPNGGVCKSVVVTNAIGGGVTVDLTDLPPLQPGTTYTVRTCNLGLSPIALNLRATIGRSLNTVFPVANTNLVAPIPILDNAVTDIFLTNNVHHIISSVDIGLLIQDPRISDLAITVVSPNGTRILLFENRGAASPDGLGTFNLGTNFLVTPFYTNDFDLASVGLYAPGAVFEGWSVLSNFVDVLDDYSCLCLSNHVLALLDGVVTNSLPTTNSLPPTNANPYTLSYKVNHLPWLEGMVTWWPLDVDGSDIFGGFNGLLLGDVAFSTGASALFFDDFSGPVLNPTWQALLPNNAPLAGYQAIPETYVGAPNYAFQTLSTNSVLRMTNTLSPQTRCGWSSITKFSPTNFRYEARFNTLDQSAATSSDGFIEIWLIDAANMNRYDLVSPYGAGSATRQFCAGSSIDNAYTNSSFGYQNNTWYRLVLACDAAHNIRASLCSDDGTELIGRTFNHGVGAFPAGFRVALSQAMGVGVGPSPADVAVDYVKLTSEMSGKVDQAFFGDGIATRMIVPGCPALDLGLGRGLSVEGWIFPANVSNSAPLVEWYDSANSFPRGVQFWLALTNGSGSFGATLWDTNLVAHVVTSPSLVLTNGGWQHVALTYDTNSGFAALYLNGLTTNQPLVTTNLGHFVPRTSGDVYLGFDPALGPTFINFVNFISTDGLNLVRSAAQNGNVLRLTPAVQDELGAAWALDKQPCASGFDTRFWFQISNLGPVSDTPPGGDGFAFTVQNNGPADANYYAPPAAPGASISILFNSDISNNFVGVVFGGAYLAQVDLTPLGLNLKDGAEHQSRIAFDGVGLSVWLDGVMLFANVPVPGMASAVDAEGKAWVGFNSHTGLTWETHDILSWTFGDSMPGTAFAGGLDEFSLYDRALTPCEVNAIFNAGSRGKYGTNVLVCPVVTEVTLLNTTAGNQTFTFTNGVTWTNNGPRWETNTIAFSTPSTNPTPIILRSVEPYNASNPNAANNLNAVVDDFVLTELVPQTIDGLLHFTENTNLATIPIKFAPAPFTTTNFAPVLLFSNSFGNGISGVYQAGANILGGTNSPGIGPRDWLVVNGPVTVVSNAFLDVMSTNYLAMATGAVQCLLPTVPGHRYQLTYSLRGPCAVGWWNGSVDPLSRRAQDIISGNDGAFYNGATNVAPGFVGGQGFYFSGQTEPLIDDPDIWIEDIDDPASKIELGNPPQLQFTNAFTIEGWIRPTVPTNATFCGTEQIFFRGYPEPFDCSGLGDPYWLALEPTTNGTRYDLHFHIAEAHAGAVGADVLTTNSPIQIEGGSNTGWWHVAAVFDKPFTNIIVGSGTNLITVTSNAMRIYVNGACVGTNYTTLSPFGDLDPALSPGVAIGGRCGYDWTEPFSGFIDELTVYARALTSPEIAAIAAAGAAGKADATPPPAQSLAELSVAVDGISLGVGYGDNSEWSTVTAQFTALDTNAVVMFQSLLPGTLFDGMTLSELPSELYYLPEVSLAALAGEDAYGIWTLEIWDSRLGPAITNALLADWQLNFHLAPSNPPPVITLSHGIAYTNALPAHGVQYFIVPVPQWATMATNQLLFADHVHTANPLPVTVFFNQTNFPSPADLALVGPLVSSGVSTLTATSVPPLLIGQPYYLALTNPNPVGVTFAIGVGFDITTLSNCQMLVSNVVSPAGIPRYFQFDVPASAASSAFPTEAVSFWLSGAQSNLTVVLSEHLPLPDLNHYDYISRQPCTNDEVIMLVTNTTPFPIQTNRWYVGVFNSAAANVSFSVQACCTTNYPVIIPLTDGIPFVVSSGSNTFAAPPGPPQRFFFDFLVIPPARAVLFELYNLSGDADLVLQQAVPPTMAPYFQTSFFTGREPEQIVVRTDPSRPADSTVPDLRGHWYLGVYNNEQTNVTYSIRAVLPDDNGILPSAQQTRISILAMSAPHGLLLSWNSVVGEHYIIQFTPNSIAPIIWTNIGSIIATTPLTTFEVLPVPSNGGFFQVVQVQNLVPTLKIQLTTTNSARVSWSTTFPGYTLQNKLGITGTNWINTAFPPAVGVIEIGNEFVVFDPLGIVPKYYRLTK